MGILTNKATELALDSQRMDEIITALNNINETNEALKSDSEITLTAPTGQGEYTYRIMVDGKDIECDVKILLEHHRFQLEQELDELATKHNVRYAGPVVELIGAPATGITKYDDEDLSNLIADIDPVLARTVSTPNPDQHTTMQSIRQEIKEMLKFTTMQDMIANALNISANTRIAEATGVVEPKRPPVCDGCHYNVNGRCILDRYCHDGSEWLRRAY